MSTPEPKSLEAWANVCYPGSSTCYARVVVFRGPGYYGTMTVHFQEKQFARQPCTPCGPFRAPNSDDHHVSLRATAADAELVRTYLLTHLGAAESLLEEGPEGISAWTVAL